MKTKIYMIVLTITLIAFAVNCKKSSEMSGDPGNNMMNEISLGNSSFSPSTLTVTVGTTVTWKHNGNTVHTVTGGTRDNHSGLFNSGDMNNGDTFQFTFSSTGTFQYHCHYHVGMDGTIIVQ